MNDRVNKFSLAGDKFTPEMHLPDIAKNLKYDGYHRGLASIVYKYFDKKTSGSGIKQNEHPLDFGYATIG